MIKTAIRCPNNMVIVFDEMGKQIPKYHGQYEEVKGEILKDAPPSAVFGCFPDYENELRIISREKW